MKFKKKYQVRKDGLVSFYVTKETDLVLDFSDGYTRNETGVLNFTGSDRNPPNPLITGVIRFPEVAVIGRVDTEPANTVKVSGEIPLSDVPVLEGCITFTPVAKVSGVVPFGEPVSVAGGVNFIRRMKVSGTIPFKDEFTFTGEFSLETPTRITGAIDVSAPDVVVSGSIRHTPRTFVSGVLAISSPLGVVGSLSLRYLTKVQGSIPLDDVAKVEGSFNHIKPSFVEGAIPLIDEVTVEGSLESVYRTFLEGSIPFNDEITVGGFLRWVVPVVTTGLITVDSALSISGELGYKDDVFRGLRKDYEHTYGKAVILRNFAESNYKDGELLRRETAFTWETTQYHHRLGVEASFKDGVKARLGIIAPYTPSMNSVHIFRGAPFSDTIRLRNGVYDAFQDFEEKLRHSQGDRFRDMVRLRREMSGMFQEAVKEHKFFLSRYNFGLEFRKNYKVKWDEATKILLLLKNLKPSIPPYIQPRVEDFKLEFKCNYRVRSRHDDCILYFGATRCKRPYSIKEGKLYMIENSVLITRVSDGAEIQGTSGNVSTDIGSWCWTGALSIEDDSIDLIKTDAAAYPMIDVKINNDTYRLLVEGYKRTRSFGKTQYSLTCRSLTALLSGDYAAPITYTNQTEMSAVQLIQEIVYNAVGDMIRVEWSDLVSDLGWVLAPNSVSFANVSPIDAIRQIVEPVGGVVFSHPNQPVITIKKAYPYAHWETPLVIDHDLPVDMMVNESTDWSKTDSKNAVFVTDTVTGNQARVYRRGTSGNRLAEEVTSPVLSTDLAMQSSGKHALTVNNPSEVTGWNFPFLPEIRYLYPCDIMRVREAESSWWGTVTGVDLNFAVSNDFIDVTYSVKTTRFMEEGLE